MMWLAASVHLFTALGSVCALFATIAVIERQAETVFFWLGIALIVDGIDGTFARAVRVKERLPRFSGDRLDLVIDYITYVFVPVLALLQWRYLSGTSGSILAGGILLSSLFHFSDLDSKADDNCFVGFPAIWNAVAFYVFAFDMSQGVTALIVTACIAGTFIPMHWLHPLRVETLRSTTLIVSAVFAVAAIVTIYSGFPAHWLSQCALAVVAIYGAGLAIFWNRITKLQ